MKQFNGFDGCGKCKESGSTLDIGLAKNNRRKTCHIYPIPENEGCPTPRDHNEVKAQALQALSNQESGMRNWSVQGILGLSWGFALPTFDVVKGTIVDYMHCVCEGVVEQLLGKWFSPESKLYPCFLGGDHLTAIDDDLMCIRPISEVTRRPRHIQDRSQWKASEKRAFLLYYSLPLLLGRLPDDYFEHYALLVGGMYRLLKSSISTKELQEATLFLRLFCAKAPGYYEERFQTYNVHQLLHLAETVRDAGPLWSNSCFPFEDFNGDLCDLFHGTQNIAGQILYQVSVLQKLPEIANSVELSPCVQEFYEHLTVKSHNTRKATEQISEKAFVIGALERVWSNCTVLTQNELRRIDGIGKWRRKWIFKRCQLESVIYHSKSYNRVTARNNFTVSFLDGQNLLYGSVLSYVKVEETCHNAECQDSVCTCAVPIRYFALVEVLESDPTIFLPKVSRIPIIKHIVRVKPSQRISVVSLVDIKEKCLRVDVSSGSYVCHMPNTIERD